MAWQKNLIVKIAAIGDLIMALPIFVEIWRLVASKFSFWLFLLCVTLMRREIVRSWPQAEGVKWKVIR